jgi:hypothetical protein
MAVGQAPPSTDFWLPISKQTVNMNPKDKIFLLGKFIPLFRENDMHQDTERAQKITELPELLTKVCIYLLIC